MEVLVFIIPAIILMLIVCVIGSIVEIIWKIFDPSHDMFSGKFWTFDWVFGWVPSSRSSFSDSGNSDDNHNEDRDYKEWKADQRAQKVYNEYKRYRNIGYSDDEAEAKMRRDGYSRDEYYSARNEYNKGCYIATASLQGGILYEKLLPLKQWRYDVMERSNFGNKLSNYYRRTAPELANKVDQMPLLGRFLRECFIKPSLSIVTKKRNAFRNILLYINFFLVLGLTTILTKFKKF